MDEFAKFIDSKLSQTPRNVESDNKMKALTDKYFVYFIDKLFTNYNYYMYNKQQYICIYDFNIHFPLFNATSESFMTTIDFSLFKHKHDDIIILPILIYNKKNTVHITTFYINTLKKHVLYFDSYSYSNNDLIDSRTTNTLVSFIKDELLVNDIIKQNYIFTVLDNGWQNHIKHDKNPWYYYYSCIILQVLFSLFYFNIHNKQISDIIELIEDLNKAIEQNPEKLREIAANTYLRLMTNNE